MTNGITVSKLLISLTAMAVSLVGSAAYADSPWGRQGDLFNRSTPPAPSTALPPQPQRPQIVKSEIRRWFEAMDEKNKALSPSLQQQAILNRPFGSPPQLERVTEWMNTASVVAKNFRQLAQYVKNSPIPQSIANDPEATELMQYKQDLSEWYIDSASWFEDYIKPRSPARTIEELDGQIKAMQNRSDQQKLAMEHLQQMDSNLREHFKIHKTDDSIWIYASKQLTDSRHEWAKVQEVPKSH
jgi:hypothetical protein